MQLTLNKAEQQNEIKRHIISGLLTLIICLLILLLFWWVRWENPVTETMSEGFGIEVQLGEDGNEDLKPNLPVNTAQTTPVLEKNATPVETIPPDDNLVESESDIAVNNKKNITKSITPLPVKKEKIIPKPKAVMNLMNSPGKVNKNTDTYESTTKETNNAKGKKNGNPNSDSYTGTGTGGDGNSISIRSGLKGRKINKYPSFEDDFNENAKISVDITVDNNGNVSMATINPKGTTTTNKKLWNIAISKAKQLKLNPISDGDFDKGTLLFNFKLKE